MTEDAVHRRHRSPRLVPTGNVDDVFLTGKSRGRDLTRFQATALTVLGLFVAICGVLTIVFQFAAQSHSVRMGISYGEDYSSLAWGIGLSLLGGMWTVMGLIAIASAVRRNKRSLKTTI